MASEENGNTLPKLSQGSSTLSRKRFFAIKLEMEKEFKEDEVEKILNILKDVMLFDPEKSTYTKEKGQKSIQYVKDKHVKTGISFYVLSGQAKQYAKKKLNQTTEQKT